MYLDDSTFGISAEGISTIIAENDPHEAAVRIDTALSDQFPNLQTVIHDLIFRVQTLRAVQVEAAEARMTRSKQPFEEVAKAGRRLLDHAASSGKAWDTLMVDAQSAAAATDWEPSEFSLWLAEACSVWVMPAKTAN